MVKAGRWTGCQRLAPVLLGYKRSQTSNNACVQGLLASKPAFVNIFSGRPLRNEVPFRLSGHVGINH